MSGRGTVTLAVVGGWPAGGCWTSSASMATPRGFQVGFWGGQNARVIYSERWGLRHAVLINGHIDLPPSIRPVTARPPQRVQAFIAHWAWLTGVTAVLPLLVGASRLVAWRRRRRTGGCPNCGYDLTGNVSGVCPECGTLVVKAGTACDGA
jgi:hypothetical protein